MDYPTPTEAASNSSIPILRNPPDHLRQGPNSYNYAAGSIQQHPIAKMQQQEQGMDK